LRTIDIPVVTIQPSFARTAIVSKAFERIDQIIKETDKSLIDSYPVDFAERLKLTKAKISTITIEPEQVVEALWHAYIVSRPNNHYPVGVLAWAFNFLSILPSEVADAILRFVL